MTDPLYLHGLIGGAEVPEDWVRTADWLPMPTVLPTEEKFVGLHAVFEEKSNFVAFTFSGAYTVDWGDGTSENFAIGAKAQKEYNYASIPSNTESVRGYRQVIITVTPQAGQNLTVFNLRQRHDTIGGLSGYNTGFLDIAVSMPNAAVAGLGISSTAGGGAPQPKRLERVNIVASGATNYSGIFFGCTALQEVILPDMSAVTVTSSMFGGCTSLRQVPLFDTSAVTVATSMFSSCTSLQTVPAFDFSSLAGAATMFINCSALVSVPALNFSGLTSAGNANAMFTGCNNLASAPFTGPAFSFSIANCLLDGPALDAIYTNLPTVSAGQIITVTGNYGTATHNPSIATAKGWTVTS